MASPEEHLQHCDCLCSLRRRGRLSSQRFDSHHARGAAVFTILYLLLFVYFLALYPDFIERYYNLPNISGIRLLGVPIEELMFAASGGAVWSVAYEYFQGYRFAPGGGYRFVEM